MSNNKYTVTQKIGGPSVQEIAAYFRAHQVDGRTSEREAVLSALAELALSRDPVTVAGIQRTVEMQRRSTIAAERVREILADCEADVVRKVVQALRTQGMRRPTPELVQRLAYALYQQDMALSRVRAYLEGGEAWPGEL